MSDKTGCQKTPNFFPGNSFLHRAELLEPGLSSYPAAECGLLLSYVGDPIARESRRIGQILWRNRQTLEA
jgi:hypothetical protein